MSAPVPAYRIVSKVHVNRWVEDLQRTVAGWELRAYWTATGATLPVFVPEEAYTPDNVDTLIRSAGATEDAIHALGG